MSDVSRPRVLLVREWDSQHSGSGCCGRLGGEACDVGDASTYAHTRHQMEEMGEIYRALRQEFGDRIDVTVVDPRNTIWIVPSIYRDARRAGASRRQAAHAVRRGVSYAAVVVDGRVVSDGHVPTPATVVAAVRDVLAERGRTCT